MVILSQSGKVVYGTDSTWTNCLLEWLADLGFTSHEWKFEYDLQIYPGVQIRLRDPDAENTIEERRALKAIAKI